MTWDRGLEQRVRELTTHMPDITDKRMFGGVFFMIRGNMVCGVIKQDLVLRLSLEEYQIALMNPGVRPKLNSRGKLMTGVVLIASETLTEDEQLENWLSKSEIHARSLAPK